MMWCIIAFLTPLYTFYALSLPDASLCLRAKKEDSYRQLQLDILESSISIIFFLYAGISLLLSTTSCSFYSSCFAVLFLSVVYITRFCSFGIFNILL